jgi:hypothetical protein
VHQDLLELLGYQVEQEDQAYKDLKEPLGLPELLEELDQLEE